MRTALFASLLAALCPALAFAEEPSASTGTPAPATGAPVPATTAPTAAPTAAPAPATAASPTAKPPIGSFRARYIEAREALFAGKFDDCRDSFAALAAEAPSESDRLLASEMADVCGTLAKKNLALVHQKDLGESSISAKAAGIRTTDELVLLYTNAVFYGVGTGVFVGTVTDARSVAGYVLPMIGTAGLGTGLVYAADRGKGIPYGVPQSITTGMYLGLEQGLLWTIWQESKTRSDRWEESTIATVIWASSTLGGVAGGLIGANTNATPGRASWVGSAGLWTGAVAGLVGLAAHGTGRGEEGSFALSAAVGVAAGAVTGLATAVAVSPSIARVRFIDLGGIAGGLLAGGLYAVAAERGNGSVTAAALVTAVGIGGGLGVAAWLTSGMPKDEGVRGKEEARIVPTVAPTRGGATFGLAGTF